MPAKNSLESESNEPLLANPGQRFLIGAFLSGVPVLAYLSLSVDMSYDSWAAVEHYKLGISVVIPLLCGVLSAWQGQRMIQFLSSLLESANLPF